MVLVYLVSVLIGGLIAYWSQLGPRKFLGQTKQLTQQNEPKRDLRVTLRSTIQIVLVMTQPHAPRLLCGCSRGKRVHQS
ncbi:hypothetical protein F4823DRAFT_595710 [Ustulina deusta]|nr:hypothetical protein F4823DRAFT_595710 [Ustulina deusta]